MKSFYIMINGYRSSTSEGFRNTWGLFKCKNRKHQLELLSKGLPVNDCWRQDGSKIYSTNGIRLPKRSEIKAALKYENIRSL